MTKTNFNNRSTRRKSASTFWATFHASGDRHHARNCGSQGTEEALDIRDFEPGETYFAIADASRGGRCVMNGMFIAAWKSKGEAKAAAGDNPNYTVVKCQKPQTSTGVA